MQKHSEEYYKRLAKAGIKVVPAGPKEKVVTLGATKHLGSSHSKPRSAAEEQFLAWLEKHLGRKLSEQERNMAIVQAEQIGEL